MQSTRANCSTAVPVSARAQVSSSNASHRSSRAKCSAYRCVEKPFMGSNIKVTLTGKRQAATVRALPIVAGEQLRVMIAGAPAAGKGTQCAKIVQKFGLVHISVGDLLREQVAQGTDAGKRAKEFMDSGDLVPNEVVVDMVKSRLAQPDCETAGWLLDGYPRSQEQAEAIEKESIRPDIFLLIEVPDDLLVERVVGRRMDPSTGEIYHLKFKPPPAEVVDRLVQRSDDTEEKVRNRLATHHRNVDSVVDFYRDVLVEINGHQSMDAVFADIENAIDRVLPTGVAATA